MTSVFLGGSRAVSRLNPVIREQLDNLIARQCKILIGDANGADKAMQKHFADKQYPHVVVFCMTHPRNNLGNWEIRAITSERKTRDSEYYATKDRIMGREARCGLMLWDGASKGTLGNILELVNDRKTALVYFAPEKKLFKLTNDIELEALLSHCDQSQLANLKQRLQPRLQLKEFGTG